MAREEEGVGKRREFSHKTRLIISWVSIIMICVSNTLFRNWLVPLTIIWATYLIILGFVCYIFDRDDSFDFRNAKVIVPLLVLFIILSFIFALQASLYVVIATIVIIGLFLSNHRFSGKGD